VPSDLKRVTVALSRLRALDRTGTEKIAVDPEAKPDLISSSSSNRNPYIGTDSYNVDKLLAEARYPFEARYLVAGLVSQGLVLPIEGQFALAALISRQTIFLSFGHHPQTLARVVKHPARGPARPLSRRASYARWNSGASGDSQVGGPDAGLPCAGTLTDIRPRLYAPCGRDAHACAALP
jgi:hypothetical protein